MIELRVNGKPVRLPEGSVVAVAIALAGVEAPRMSVRGEPRGPLCGMGICFECRAIIDGQPHQRTCQIPVHQGMEVLTDGG